ncbi:MAG: hypothetical protein ACFFCM_19475 [Promethearchaeota archaeon]
MTYSLKIKEFILERTITVNSDNDMHKKQVQRGIIAATIFSISYGFYEYFIVYGLLVPILGAPFSITNWFIMFFGMLFVVALTTQFSVEKSLMAWLYLTVIEDLFYWIANWIHTGVYPFPAPNWWDGTLATFRLLGGLGQAITFWPYIPFYYIPGFVSLIIYYSISYQSAKYGRILAWIVGPFTLAILGGALPGIFGLTSDLLVTIILIILPTLSYSFFLFLLHRNDWKFKEK